MEGEDMQCHPTRIPVQDLFLQLINPLMPGGNKKVTHT